MDFQTWYVIYILGFASGLAVFILWDEAFCILVEIRRAIRNDKPKNRHNGGRT